MLSRVMRAVVGLPSSRMPYGYSQKKGGRQPQWVGEEREEKSRSFMYVNIAIMSFMFGVCFAGIPLYRRFCEKMGINGDQDKKQYDFKGTKINNMKKYTVKFTGNSDSDVEWEFEPIEKEVVVSAGETAIVFYRIYNKQNHPVVGFSTYNIWPEDINTYFSKIQCFCFNQQLINPKEELILPLFFYLEPELNEDTDCNRVKEIHVAYNFTKSAKQDLAKFAAEELKRVEENKRKLNEIRARKMGLSINQYLAHLAEQQERQEAEDQRLKQQAEDKEKEAERRALREEKRFEEELLKAELISQAFTPQNIYSQTKKKADSVA